LNKKGIEMEKNEMLTVSINDKEVEIPTGETILDAARKAGIWIPTLCHHDALEPEASCRLCLVEIEDRGRRRLVASCAYPAADGIQVYTDTEQVVENRKIVAELLLARCSENEYVRNLCAELGVTDTPYPKQTEECVLCGKCVRMCNERMGVGAINFIGRGQTRKVGTPYDAYSDVCMTCGACETVCPTNCIDVRDTSKTEPQPLLSDWDVGLSQRSAIYLPFPQAVPLSTVIDPDACAHVQTGGCQVCTEFCEADAIDFTQKEEEIEIDVGSIIIATGFNLMDAKEVKQFGYGKFPNVYTSFEFERLSNATGPTGGKILIRDENGALTKPPKSVALVHCVGSRDANYHEYCSRVCCMYSLKYSHLIKEKVGHDTQVYDFYIDMRCYGKGYEEFYERCQKEGTNFIRGKVAEITDFALKPEEEGKLIAIAEDTLAGNRLRVAVDMVVLCMAMESREDATQIARTFGINVGSAGFFLEEHPKLAPLSTPTDGVFLAGTCQGPKDIPDTVAQASGAAVKALALATKGTVTVSPSISYIDPELCAGCQTCIGLCAYSAIEFDAMKNISVVNEALCKGCGSCSGFCPSNAAKVKHFNPKQVFAEIDGLMNAVRQVSA